MSKKKDYLQNLCTSPRFKKDYATRYVYMHTYMYMYMHAVYMNTYVLILYIQGSPHKFPYFSLAITFTKLRKPSRFFSPQLLEVYRILLVETTLESIMFYYTFSVINTMFVACTVLLYDSTAATLTLKLSTTLLSMSCGIHLISLLMMSSLVCGLFSLWTLFLSGTPSENSQVVWDLGNKVASGYRFGAKWVCPMGRYAWGFQVFCSKNKAPSHFSNRTLEYLRHNFPWDKLISRQTDNSWPSYSQDLNPPDCFARGYLKERVYKTICRQERISLEKKSHVFHKKCSMELWTILMFELLLYCHTATRYMEQA